MTWTCTVCEPPLVFTSFAKAERHARAAHSGGRITVNVEERRPRP